LGDILESNSNYPMLRTVFTHITITSAVQFLAILLLLTIATLPFQSSKNSFITVLVLANAISTIYTSSRFLKQTTFFKNYTLSKPKLIFHVIIENTIIASFIYSILTYA
jgi:hypothetical protein